MKRGLLLCTILLASIFSASTSFAQVTIGNGFSCSGTSIVKGAKTIPFSRAKSTLETTIAKLRVSLADAPKKKKESIREKIAAANNSKTLLRACTSGTLSPDQVDPIFTQLASGSGNYEGTYSGSVGGFQSISGPVTMAFVLDGTTFSTLLTIGGNIGSALDAKPLSFSADVGGIGFPAKFTLENTFIGTVVLSISQQGHLTITNSNSSKGTISFDGIFDGTTIAGSLNGSYSGIPFQGSFTMLKQ